MKIPNTPAEFEKELYVSIDLMNTIGDLRIRQFMDKLEKVPDKVILKGILNVFENTNRIETQYEDQKYAGKILARLNPKSNLDLLKILKSTLGNWNKSVEEFPSWMRENYGIGSVKKKLTEFEMEDLTEMEMDKLNAMKWWLKI